MFLPRHRPVSSFLRRLLNSTTTTISQKRQHGIHLEEASTFACRLTSRAVIKIHGPDAIKFLQGLLTNDVKRILSPTSPSMYNAVLTSQGRFLYDIFLYKPLLPREDLLYADVGVDVVDELLDSFKRWVAVIYF